MTSSKVEGFQGEIALPGVRLSELHNSGDMGMLILERALPRDKRKSLPLVSLRGDNIYEETIQAIILWVPHKINGNVLSFSLFRSNDTSSHLPSILRAMVQYASRSDWFGMANQF